MKTRKLWKHQINALNYAGRIDHPAFFMEMRLGKTLVTVRNLLDQFDVSDRILIVSPYEVLTTWQRELIAEGVPESDITFLTGEREERLDLLKKRTPFCLINKEGHFALPEIGLDEYKWNAVVADESTFLKAPPKMKWSKTYGKRANTARFYIEHFRSARRYILSGLPSPESELDLWSQLQFLDPMILGCKSYYEFRFKYFESRDARGHDYYLTKEGQEFLQARLSTWCFCLTRRDVNLDVRKVYARRLVQLPASVRRTYRTAEKKFILEIKSKVKAVTNFALQSFIWTRRIAGGWLDGELHRAKIDALLELLSGELRGDIVIVYATFIAECEWIWKECGRLNRGCAILHGGVTHEARQTVLSRFREGIIPILVVQPECFKYGIDLSVCDTVIYYSSPLGLESRLQSEDRVVNVKSRHPALYIDLLAEDTVDEDIYESLARKETNAELLRRLIKRAT